MSSTLKNVLNVAPAPPFVLRTPSILQNNFGVWHSNLIKLNAATKWKANPGFIAPWSWLSVFCRINEMESCHAKI